MKKILALAALALAATAASATSVVVEYDYHSVNGSPNGYTHNQYGYVGVTQDLGKFGIVDAGLQGAGATTSGATDRQAGWEVGYSYALPVGKVTLLPRLATGAMNRIYDGAGGELNARYWLGSLEANMPLVEKVGGYVSVSHMNGINADSVKRANRVQAGVDLTVAPNLSLRAGYSHMIFGSDTLNGVVLIGTYSF